MRLCGALQTAHTQKKKIRAAAMDLSDPDFSDATTIRAVSFSEARRGFASALVVTSVRFNSRTGST